MKDIATKNKTVSVEALGYKWELSENDLAANQAKKALEYEARRYFMSFERMNSRLGAYNVMLPYYPEILSATVSIVPLEAQPDFDGDTFWMHLYSTPAAWFELIAKTDPERTAVTDLLLAARKLNPDWYPDQPLEDAPAEIQEAVKFVQSSTDPVMEIEGQALNTEPVPTPDTEAVVLAADKAIEYAEKKAGEAGKVGPNTFPGQRKNKA